MAITFHLWSHTKCNSFYLIEYQLNYSNFSGHLEVVSGLMHAQYQNILWCYLFPRAVWFTIITFGVQKHEV